MSKARPELIQALLVDDEPAARDELSFLLEQCGDVCIVGEASSASEALAHLASDAPTSSSSTSACPVPTGSRSPKRSRLAIHRRP